MKKLLAAAVIATSATSATAGAYSDPIIESVIIIEDAASSADHSWIVPAMFLLMLLVASKSVVPGLDT